MYSKHIFISKKELYVPFIILGRIYCRRKYNRNIRGAFKTLSKINDGAFRQNNLHCRCLAGSLKPLFKEKQNSENTHASLKQAA